MTVYYLTNLGVQSLPAIYRTLHVAINAAKEFRVRYPRLCVWIGPENRESDLLPR